MTREKEYDTGLHDEGNMKRSSPLWRPEVNEMLSSVLNIGLESLDRVASVAIRRRQGQVSLHPLAAYPRLQELLIEAERSGTLAAERRRLIRRKIAA